MCAVIALLLKVLTPSPTHKYKPHFVNNHSQQVLAIKFQILGSSLFKISGIITTIWLLISWHTEAQTFLKSLSENLCENLFGNIAESCRKPSESLPKTFRKPPENLPKTFQKLFENQISRKPPENLPKTSRKPFENLRFRKPLRKSSENLSKSRSDCVNLLFKPDERDQLK